MGLKRLYIDLDKCLDCEQERCRCSYIFHPENNGIISIREIASFAIICRKCEQGTCVLSCPKDALEKREDGVVKRYHMRCVGCKSCTLACPFGTIIPDVIPYRVSTCDFCIGRLKEDEVPLCVSTCPSGALRYGEYEPDEEKGEYLIGENLIARAYAWDRIAKRVPVKAKK